MGHNELFLSYNTAACLCMFYLHSVPLCDVSPSYACGLAAPAYHLLLCYNHIHHSATRDPLRARPPLGQAARRLTITMVMVCLCLVSAQGLVLYTLPLRTV